VIPCRPGLDLHSAHPRIVRGGADAPHPWPRHLRQATRHALCHAHRGTNASHAHRQPASLEPSPPAVTRSGHRTYNPRVSEETPSGGPPARTPASDQNPPASRSIACARRTDRRTASPTPAVHAAVPVHVALSSPNRENTASPRPASTPIPGRIHPQNIDPLGCWLGCRALSSALADTPP
jgi:hypothetical protein